MGYSAPADRRQTAGENAPNSGTGAFRRSSCQRSTGGALLPSELRSPAIACGETGPPPCPPERRSETPGPWRYAASAAIPGPAVDAIGVGNQRRVIEEIGQHFAALRGIRRCVDQFHSGSRARLGVRVRILLQHPLIAGAIENQPDQLIERPLGCLGVQLLDHRSGRPKAPLRRASGRRDPRAVRPIAAPNAQLMFIRELLDLLDRGLADSARGSINDAQQADRIVADWQPPSGRQGCP